MCTGGRAVVHYVITKFSRLDSLPNFRTHGAPLPARFARESSAITLSDVKSFKSVLMMFHIVDFSGLNKLHSITKGELFLCDSGDEILWGEERCDLRNDCYDFSDEKNCSNRKLRL